jgi:hypothetical protein
METLYEAYRMAKENGGASAIDGVTFEAIEESGVEGFLRQIRDELITNPYRPVRARKKEIPKDGGRSAFFRFHLSTIVWFREHLSSYPGAAACCGPVAVFLPTQQNLQFHNT